MSAIGDATTGFGMKLATGSALGALAIIIGAQAAQAEPAVRVDTQMFVERVSTDVNGRTRRVLASADRVAPGDQLIVMVHWRNQGGQPLRDYALVRPLPKGVELDPSDPALQVSVDGGVRWGRMADLWLPTPLGGVRRAVPADITHMRWPLPDSVPPGQTGRLSYRATIR